ncbi:MAG: hypothetical protein KF851_00605 [Pirellulaceae bacterium]|nr:hypothetical protein [Pirellulaceae bacterium]
MSSNRNQFKTTSTRDPSTREFGGTLRCGREYARRSYIRRNAFTLLELILVLGILILVASLSSPALLRAVSGQGLDKGCDMVRAEMARARVRAIRSGKVQALLFAPGGNRMVVQDFDKLANDPRVMSMGQQEFDMTTNLVSDDGVLPRSVRFAAAEAVANSRSEFESMTAGGGGNSGVRPVLFYPDGTCQDARVILVNDRGEMKQVVLRSLTGTSRVSLMEEGQR